MCLYTHEHRCRHYTFPQHLTSSHTLIEKGESLHSKSIKGEGKPSVTILSKPPPLHPRKNTCTEIPPLLRNQNSPTYNYYHARTCTIRKPT
jgi:hypothetical protein